MIDVTAKLQRAVGFHQRGQLAMAKTAYQDVLKIAPEQFDALHFLGIVAGQMGQPAEAVAIIERALRIDPTSFAAHNNRGNALNELGRYEDAVESFDRAIALKPGFAEAFNNRGNALREMKRFEAAVASYDRAISLLPGYPDAFNNRGVAYSDLGRFEDAMASYDQAIRLEPRASDPYNNRGNALCLLGRYEEALKDYQKTLSLQPDHADAFNNLGNALHALQSYLQAIEIFKKAIKLRPDFAEAYNNLGNSLHRLHAYEAALTSFNQSIALSPHSADAYNNRGNLFDDTKRYDEAIADYNQAIALGCRVEGLPGRRRHTKSLIGDWSGFDADVVELSADIDRGLASSNPFSVLAWSDSPELQRKAAGIWGMKQCPADRSMPQAGKIARRDKIRIGYFSADFHNHATMYLLAEMLELHDRARFEVIAFSFGNAPPDEMSARVRGACLEVIDVRAASDRDVALLARKLVVDIGVDLKGYTYESRPGIFARRAAPVQVNYLGFPATMGVSYMDYIVADRVVIPEMNRQNFAEEIVYLPDSYQVNDGKRAIADNTFTREELGLPSSGFVYCCFNNNYKITPAMFDVWMRILAAVNGSVLWLFEDNPAAAKNLRLEAVRRGMKADRLVFARRKPLPEHLARHRCADLFLDTLPYNAHTTASDALWAGLPVLTCIGTTFCGRVAASLLATLRLDHLITSSIQEYERRAVELGLDRDQVRSLGARLARGRLTTSLFDARRYTRHLESGYQEMYERSQSGRPPGMIFT